MYLYMPIASSTNPPMNWGYAATKQGFLHAVTRGQYEKVRMANLLGSDFLIQIRLQAEALMRQFSWPVALFGLVPVVILIWQWRALQPRARRWLVFVLAAFLTTLIGLLIVINPGLDKTQQEINMKFFAPAHGFFAMFIGYGIALAVSVALARWHHFPRLPLRLACVALLALPLIPLNVNWRSCEQRGHDFGYQFGYRMFYPGGEYPPMEKDAVLFGGTDPGRFVPTYMIFCESFVPGPQKYHDPNFDPTGGGKFDRRDVYIITQNALADATYMSYIRDHYDYSRPTNYNFFSRWLGRHETYPVEPIYIPTPPDLQRAFQEYVNDVEQRRRRGQPLSPEEQVDVSGGQVQVRGVAGVMNINGILCKWIHDRNKAKHSFYVEESYVIPWMYDYLEPYGIIMKINKDPTPNPQQNPGFWTQLAERDRKYWDQLCKDFAARPEFRRDNDAQKTFSKLRSAIGGLYSSRRLLNEALYAFQQALQLCPESPEANFRLAQLYLELGRADEAVKTLETYQQLDPLNSKVGAALQQIRQMKQQGSQLQQLEQAVASGPTNVANVIHLAQAYASLSQGDRINPLFERYLAQTNIPPTDMLQIAQSYIALNDPNRCLQTILLTISRHPDSSDAYSALAVIRTAQSMTNEAFAALQKAVELNPAIREPLRTDQRFNSLRSDPRFQQIITLSAPPANP
jgi:tetratricopeptide (TPR) repeat protein